MNYTKLTKKQLIEQLELKVDSNINICNNVITTKVWDDKAIEAVNNTAKALLNLTELFKSTNVEITTIKIK